MSTEVRAKGRRPTVNAKSTIALAVVVNDARLGSLNGPRRRRASSPCPIPHVRGSAGGCRSSSRSRAVGLVLLAASQTSTRGGSRNHRVVAVDGRAAPAVRGAPALPGRRVGRTRRVLLAGTSARRPGRLPTVYPTVCVQLPMFNEHAVARRVIEAAAAMTWPRDRFSVQVLDDSTDPDTRALVEAVCADVRASTGVNCYVRHRVDRRGYKAGALEEGRRQIDAEFLAIFDSDFLPPPDFLLKAMPHFFVADRPARHRSPLVQAQWGHLNHDESALTLAQSLWVDDHHTVQMSGARRCGSSSTSPAPPASGAPRRSKRSGAHRRQPGRGLRAELPPSLRGVPHEVRQGDRRARRASRDLHGVQSAAEALDAGVGAVAEAAPRLAATPLPLLRDCGGSISSTTCASRGSGPRGRFGSRCCRS